MRDQISLFDHFEMFPDDAAAERWFIKSRWPDGLRCAYCDGENVNAEAKHPTMPHYCNAWRKYFSAKTNSIIYGSKLGYRKWALAYYLLTSNIKGVSSMQLHRYIGVRQATAWHMAHRIRAAMTVAPEQMTGEVEVD